MQARYYDPVIGRFYSNDPVGFRDVHSFNRYAYANNNPYKYVDPTGMCSSFPGQETTSDCTHEIEQSVSRSTTENSNGSVSQSRTTTITTNGNSSSLTGTIVNLPQSSLGGAPATATTTMQEKLLDLSVQTGKTVQITSGVRTKVQNDRVKGGTNSPHLDTNDLQAADIAIQGLSRTQTATQAHSSGLFNRVNEYDPSLSTYKRGKGVHVDLKPKDNQGFFINWYHQKP